MPRPRNVPFSGCACGKSSDCPLFGFCHCGCGQKTTIAKYSSSAQGTLKGFPTRFILGHQGADRTGINNSSEFKINGNPCRLIPLTQGQYAIVDSFNYERITVNKYHARIQGGKVYAVRVERHGKTNKSFYMHREIMRLEEGDTREVDHIEPLATTLNIESNLRLASSENNRQNTRVRKDSGTQLKWAQFHPHSGLYLASVTFRGKKYSLRYHKTAQEAHEVAAAFARKLHGEFFRE